MSTKAGTASGPPEVVPNVDDLTKPVGTRTATVPRYYLLPPSLSAIAAKLRAHNIRVTTIDKPVRMQGEEFTITRMYAVRRAGYDMTTLDGSPSPNPQACVGTRTALAAPAEIAPGVHRMGTLAHTYVEPLGYECFSDPPRAATAPVAAGGAVVFSSLTPHLTGPNRTGEVRKAYILQYAPAGAETLVGDPAEGPPRARRACDDPDRQFAVLRGGEPA